MIALPRLYAIVDTEVCGRSARDPRGLARAYLAGGARLLQLRAKDLPSGRLLDLAAAIAADARAEGATLVVNDRADLAVLAAAAGVHVGQDDLAPEDVRRVVGPDALVGFSTHTVAQIEDALARPISYLAVGPVFGTQTKDTGYDAVGLDLVRTAVRLAGPRGLPVVGIGGITRARAPDVWSAGAASVAVITDLLTDDPAARVAEWLRAADAFDA